MKTVRKGVFETNSSSTHALCLSERSELDSSDKLGLEDVYDEDSGVLSFDWIGAEKFCRIRSVAEKIRFILGIIAEVVRHEHTEKKKTDAAKQNYMSLWPLANVKEIKKHKLFKAFRKNLLTGIEKKTGIKATDISLGHWCDRYEDTVGNDWWLDAAKVIDKNGNATQYEKKSMLQELVNIEELVLVDLDHEVGETAYFWSWKKFGSLRSFFFGYDPVTVALTPGVDIAYWRNG